MDARGGRNDPRQIRLGARNHVDGQCRLVGNRDGRGAVFLGEILADCFAVRIGEHVLINDDLGDVAQKPITAVLAQEGIAAEMDRVAVGLVKRRAVEPTGPLVARRDVV